MTEPVAYMYEDHVFKTEKEAVLFKKEFDRYKHDNMLKHVILPLFTADEISDIYKQNKRVKMTQKQYDRLMWDKQNTDLSTCISYFLEHDGVNKFGLSSENLMGLLTQEDIARAWLNPEETIEIVHVKWFVRSKELLQNSKYMWLCNAEYLYVPQCMFTNDDQLSAIRFDTKEEAELWKNPLTEVVQLPVEGE